MATNAERQARYRAERLKNGERELKGVYVPEHLHVILKQIIRLLVTMEHDLEKFLKGLRSSNE